MRMLTIPPSERVSRFVRSFTIVEAREVTTRTLTPDTGIVLGFRYAGFAREVDGAPTTPLPDAVVSGLRDTPRRMLTSAGGGIILATFHEGAAAAFFAEPLDQLFGASVPLSDLAPRDEIDGALSRVATARDHGQRVSIVEEFLLMRRRTTGDGLVAAAVREIRAAHGSIRVGELARTLAVSRDRLEKRFRRAVGTSPKQLASILRLRRAVELHRSGASLTRVSLDAGYFDQSHFIREFRRFMGEAPRRLLGSSTYC